MKKGLAGIDKPKNKTEFFTEHYYCRSNVFPALYDLNDDEFYLVLMQDGEMLCKNENGIFHPKHVNIWQNQPNTHLIFNEVNRRRNKDPRIWTPLLVQRVLETASKNKLKFEPDHVVPTMLSTDAMKPLFKYCMQNGILNWQLLPQSKHYVLNQQAAQRDMAYFIYSITKICDEMNQILPETQQKYMSQGQEYLIDYFLNVIVENKDKQHFLNQANNPSSSLGLIFKFKRTSLFGLSSRSCLETLNKSAKANFGMEHENLFEASADIPPVASAHYSPNFYKRVEPSAPNMASEDAANHIVSEDAIDNKGCCVVS